MRVVIFCHSLASDWNHGNAHFLRGICSELIARGHDVHVYEPRDGWSRQNLIAYQGDAPLANFEAAFPRLRSEQYDLHSLDLERALDHAALVLVHEWNPPELVERIGRHRRRGRFRLLFHDTHHRAATRPEEMGLFDLRDYDGVLAYGEALRLIYEERGWAERAWTWHEAADTRTFRPVDADTEGDLVWIGNWGDEERTAELCEFVFEPARRLRLSGAVYGVRFPWEAQCTVAQAGLAYHGWIPNYLAPQAFARHRLTVHVPRRPYVDKLPGIPTIRPFEAMACGIPLVCALWHDSEGLFRAGDDHLVARNGGEMREHMRAILRDPALAASLRVNGLATIRARHTCAHRVDELLAIHTQLEAPSPVEVPV